MNTVTDSKLVFSAYSEYATFLKNIGANEVSDLEKGLYEALIDNDLTPREAKDFLADDLDIDKITEIRLYVDRVVFQFEDVEFSDGDFEGNYAGFIMGYNFETKKWFWIEMI